MTEELQVILPYLDKVAGSIYDLAQNNGQYIFNLAVKQVYSNAIISLVDSIATFFLIYIFYVIGNRVWKFGNNKANGEYSNQTWFEYNDGMSTVIFVLGIVTIISSVMLFIGSVCGIEKAVNLLINPEYNAIKDIIQSVK
jgi:hypothetical protein